MRRNLEDPGARRGYDYISRFRDISVGQATLMGDHANVPTSATLKLNGRDIHLHGTARLRNVEGAWKVIIVESDKDDPARGLCALWGIPYNPLHR